MHSNPFTDYGHDIRNLQSELQRKADNHEVSSLRGDLDRLERSVDMGRDEHRREVDGLRSRIEELEARLTQLEDAIANQAWEPRS
jgi:polyhydroxyalkanoate synthesis regulator phasin